MCFICGMHVKTINKENQTNWLGIGPLFGTLLLFRGGYELEVHCVQLIECRTWVGLVHCDTTQFIMVLSSRLVGCKGINESGHVRLGP